MICAFHLDNILTRPDLLPLFLKARQASWGLAFILVTKCEAEGAEFEEGEPEILFACGGPRVLRCQAFQFTQCCSVCQFGGTSAVLPCLGARLRHSGNPAALVLLCQHHQDAASLGYSIARVQHHRVQHCRGAASLGCSITRVQHHRGAGITGVLASPGCSILGVQHHQDAVPMAAQGGCSSHPCALFSFAESDLPSLKNDCSKKTQAGTKLSVRGTI